MIFTNRIKRLREEFQMPQRQLAAALNIDTATYCKIEKGDRRAKREQVKMIAEILNTDKSELLCLWLAEKLIAIVADEKDMADKALEIAKQNLNNKMITLV